ncbi:E3 ubiquitin-protein ligase RNF169 [Merluccius polli]|uniref:E3 ubiquitin-protein ligase RNF169 n=1 Tax=Merluccius polli TaxID=89951 RepID=A0AA47PAT6_MERPO|nr:E3 ubiquitin-protein ligase RNF169 [Merluccius polli]
MAAAVSAQRPAEAEEPRPGGGGPPQPPPPPQPPLRLRSASNPQPRAPEAEARCGPPCCCCFQRPRSCPRCRPRGSGRRPGGEAAGPADPEPRDPEPRDPGGRRSCCPERCRNRLDRRTCDSRKDSSIPVPQGSWCGGGFSDPLSKVKVKTVLSDSENEEPVGKRTRNVSFRKTPSAFREYDESSSLHSASQRSQSCTASVEGGGKRRFLPQSSMMNVVSLKCSLLADAGARHSFAAGILLSSENSPAVSFPISTDRRLAWRGLMTSFPPPARPERSISPESNDSISEELNHFKPIVCSPCTPPKRLADGRLMEPTIVKSTPRNLLHGLQSPTSYQASPAVLLKWRQIELDRQSLKVTSKSTLTGSPFGPELQTGAREEELTTKARPSAEGAFTLRTRRRVFGPVGEADGFKKTAKVCVPAQRYNGKGFGAADAAHCSGSLSGPSNTRTPRTPLSKELPGAQTQNHPTSRKGKHSQKTKHLENHKQGDVKRARVLLQRSPGTPFPRESPFPRVSQDLKGRVLALKRHTPLTSENQPVGKSRAPRYLLRSGVVKQSQRRQSPRKPKRLTRKY